MVEVEDKFHFVMICPKYIEIRKNTSINFTIIDLQCLNLLNIVKRTLYKTAITMAPRCGLKCLFYEIRFLILYKKIIF